MNKPLPRLLFRWFVNSLGLWAAAWLFARVSYEGGAPTLIIAGFILSIVNGLLKPLLVVLSLPAILLSLGLFMLVINGFLILLMSWLYPSFQIDGLWAALLAGIVIALVNYIVTLIIEDKGSTPS